MAGGRKPRNGMADPSYLAAVAGFALRLQALAQVHQTLVYFSCFNQRRPLRLGFSCPFAACKIYDGEPVPDPGSSTGHARPFLDLEAEEAVTSARNAVAARSGHFPLRKANLKYRNGIL